jgi:hypothetical protein
VLGGVFGVGTYVASQLVYIGCLGYGWECGGERGRRAYGSEDGEEDVSEGYGCGCVRGVWVGGRGRGRTEEVDVEEEAWDWGEEGVSGDGGRGTDRLCIAGRPRMSGSAGLGGEGVSLVWRTGEGAYGVGRLLSLLGLRLLCAVRGKWVGRDGRG